MHVEPELGPTFWVWGQTPPKNKADSVPHLCFPAYNYKDHFSCSNPKIFKCVSSSSMIVNGKCVWRFSLVSDLERRAPTTVSLQLARALYHRGVGRHTDIHFYHILVHEQSVHPPTHPPTHTHTHTRTGGRRSLSR